MGDFMTQDNRAYEFAIATSSKDFDYDEVEFPGVEKESEKLQNCCVEALRLTMQKLVELAGGDSRTLLCLFGGLSGQSYRELSVSTGMSHEWCRAELLKLRKSNIGSALTSAQLIPRLRVRENLYVIRDIHTKKCWKVKNLKKFCRKMKLNYSTARSAMQKKHVLYCKFTIEKT